MARGGGIGRGGGGETERQCEVILLPSLREYQRLQRELDRLRQEVRQHSLTHTPYHLVVSLYTTYYGMYVYLRYLY